MKAYKKSSLFFLRIASIIVNIIPLLILLIINWKVYTKTTTESVALSVTGIFWLVFVVASAFTNVTKAVPRLIKLLILFVLLELINPLITSLRWFVLCSFIGATLDYIIIQPLIKSQLELRLATKTTTLTKEAIKEVLDGRV